MTSSRARPGRSASPERLRSSASSRTVPHHQPRPQADAAARAIRASNGSANAAHGSAASSKTPRRGVARDSPAASPATHAPRPCAPGAHVVTASPALSAPRCARGRCRESHRDPRPTERAMLLAVRDDLLRVPARPRAARPAARPRRVQRTGALGVAAAPPRQRPRPPPPEPRRAPAAVRDRRREVTPARSAFAVNPPARARRRRRGTFLQLVSDRAGEPRPPRPRRRAPRRPQARPPRPAARRRRAAAPEEAEPPPCIREWRAATTSTTSRAVRPATGVVPTDNGTKASRHVPGKPSHVCETQLSNFSGTCLDDEVDELVRDDERPRLFAVQMRLHASRRRGRARSARPRAARPALRAGRAPCRSPGRPAERVALQDASSKLGHAAPQPLVAEP